MEKFFATCPRGLESLLAEDLRALGAARVHASGGGVQFGGDMLLAYRTNLESRIASRVLWQITSGRYRNEDDIFRAAYALPWNRWLEPQRTIRIDVSAIHSPLTSLNYLTLKIKDAVCDKLRRQTGHRPSVDTRRPDVRIQAHLTEHEFTLYLDTTGDPLFKRGIRLTTGEAPLRENLAAGVLRLAGWRPGITLLDPMCGSGTFVLEAALASLDIAPGLGRRFAFENLKNFDARTWRELRERAATRRRRKHPLPIYGSDRSHDAIRAARANFEACGLEAVVTLNRADVLEIRPPAGEGIIVTNPPYGVRLGEQQSLAEFYPKLGDALKRQFSGWSAYILSADMRLPKLIRLQASRRIPLYNGALECRLFEYRIVSGKMAQSKTRLPQQSAPV